MADYNWSVFENVTIAFLIGTLNSSLRSPISSIINYLSLFNIIPKWETITQMRKIKTND
jgi:hypothetical protein